MTKDEMYCTVGGLLMVKVINDPCRRDSGPLLIRYHIWKSDRIGIYVHHLLRSDHDRSLHDHPWSFLTFRLGSYIEHTEDGAFRRPRFSIGWRRAEFKHRLELSRPVWTIVIRFRFRRTWGFWPNGVFRPWDKYLDAGCND